MYSLEDQCLAHKQKVVGSSLVTANVLCPWVRYLTIITPLNPGVHMNSGSAGKVRRRCSEPHTTENWVWLTRFEGEMGAPTCIHRLKVYLFDIIAELFRGQNYLNGCEKKKKKKLIQVGSLSLRTTFFFTKNK